MAKLTPAQQMVAKEISAVRASPMLNIPNQANSSVYSMPDTTNWIPPTPAGGAGTKGISTFDVAYPAKLTTTPKTVWSPRLSGDANYSNFVQPSLRLPTGTAALPSASPGSGLTPRQAAAFSGYQVDPQTGQLAYVNPGSNPAANAAAALGARVAAPIPASVDDRLNARARATYLRPGVMLGDPATQLAAMLGASGWSAGGVTARGPVAPIPLMRPAAVAKPAPVPLSTRAPGTPIQVLPSDSYAAAKAKASGDRAYSAGPGVMMPTTTITGESRRTYGDGSGSGNGSLIG